MPKTVTMLLCVGLVSAITTVIALSKPASAEQRQISKPSTPKIKIVVPPPKKGLGKINLGGISDEDRQGNVRSHAAKKNKDKCGNCSKWGG